MLHFIVSLVTTFHALQLECEVVSHDCIPLLTMYCTSEIAAAAQNDIL